MWQKIAKSFFGFVETDFEKIRNEHINELFRITIHNKAKVTEIYDLCLYHDKKHSTAFKHAYEILNTII